MKPLTGATGYAVAVAAVALATGARWLLDPALGNFYPFVTYYVAILAVALLASLWPSVVALILGAFAADFFFIPPRYVVLPHPEGVEHQLGLALYCMVGISSIVVCEALRAAERRADLRAADLADTNRRQLEFLALLSHELRNPLAPIRNALEILRQTGGQGDTGKLAIDMMQRQFRQLVRLVDDLLDVSRISRGRIALRREPVELASAVRRGVEAARPSCDSKELELSVAVPPEPLYLNADPARLAHIVDNLLNNACKFTGRGGRVTLAVLREGGQAVIRVQDTGIGIAADQLGRIFEMFSQVDASVERAEGGLGLGLVLVKHLVELHGGTVEAHSAGLGKGAEFVVRLPVQDEAFPPPRQEPSRASRQGRR